MKLVDDSKINLVSLCFVLACMVSIRPVCAEFTFSTPANLGSLINSQAAEAGACISADGLSLYFDSDRFGGSGGFDIWVATRKAADQDWGAPVNLGPIMNTVYEEFDSNISTDGLSLFFASDHPGGSGDFDLWVASRNTTDSDWDIPVPLGPIVNSQYDDDGPSISADGLSLYFSSNRPDGYGDADLWVTTRTTVSGVWGEPVNLGPKVNSSLWEARPNISADGLKLFFGSNQLDGGVMCDLYMTTRKTTQGPWGTPVKLGASVNSPDDEDWPRISADGRTLIFESDRPGGLGDWDLWQVSIEPVVDFNRDEKVDLIDFCMLAQYWLQDQSQVDIGPTPLGDRVIDIHDLSVLADYWLTDFRLLSHWKLDETAGGIAHDRVGE
jgi:Tol biopolymer transport system component